MIDLDDESITENTRASYPLEFIANCRPREEGRAPEEHHPPDLRRAGSHAADRAAHARPGALPVHLRLHVEDRRHRGRASARNPR